MSKIALKTATVSVEATLVLSEAEMAALSTIFTFGVDNFLEVFYKDLGETYMKPNEAGLRQLAATVARDVPDILRRAKLARQAFNEEAPKK